MSRIESTSLSKIFQFWASICLIRGDNIILVTFSATLGILDRKRNNSKEKKLKIKKLVDRFEISPSMLTKRINPDNRDRIKA